MDLIQSLNRQHLDDLATDQRVEGLIANYELAYRMQSVVPDVMDLDTESKVTHDLYGIGSEPTDNFGRQCLLARKFAERGVRDIQVSTDYTWDHHKQVQDGSVEGGGESGSADRRFAAGSPSARLTRGHACPLGAEFGRTPFAENGDGRNHHPKAFTVWMAGGGVRGGLTYGATDDFGYAPMENPFTCMTCTRPCCICWASITND